MGIDSLLSMEYLQRLEDAIGVTLPKTLLFDSPSVASLKKTIRLLLRPQAPVNTATVRTRHLQDKLFIITGTKAWFDWEIRHCGHGLPIPSRSKRSGGVLAIAERRN